ncbi:crossover junction endodeoxyribonuclease RuvC [Candidatus Sumerlaeota bacterium]
MKKKILRIMGIDPGLASTGWGIVDMCGYELAAVGCGTITTSKTLPPGERLRMIYDSLTGVVEQFQPRVVAVEKLFFSRNVKTAMDVAQARGVALLAATSGQAELAEYTPIQVKQAVVGKGRATKKQLARMVCVVVSLREAPPSDHAADALAVAVCHANFAKLANAH